ncbi:MAG: helix-turn-helix transcriptional regulator [Bacteroidetes bacterium]|nr:helix-turn-helix transcriptional regulator [Bacteroidota bacterium]
MAVTEIDKYVIKKVKKIRLEKGFSQSKLAFELDQSNSFIKKIEAGKYEKKYNVSHLYEIAKILDCSICDFFPKNNKL